MNRVRKVGVGLTLLTGSTLPPIDAGGPAGPELITCIFTYC
jgi:hypothetical protein